MDQGLSAPAAHAVIARTDAWFPTVPARDIAVPAGIDGAGLRKRSLRSGGGSGQGRGAQTADKHGHPSVRAEARADRSWRDRPEDPDHATRRAAVDLPHL